MPLHTGAVELEGAQFQLNMVSGNNVTDPPPCKLNESALINNTLSINEIIDNIL